MPSSIPKSKLSFALSLVFPHFPLTLLLMALSTVLAVIDPFNNFQPLVSLTTPLGPTPLLIKFKPCLVIAF